MKEAPNMRIPTFEELSQGNTESRKKAFDVFVASKHSNLVGLARNRLLGSAAKDSAEDAVQDALWGTWRSIPKMREDSNIEAYMKKAVVSKAMKYGGKKTREQQDVNPYEPDDLVELAQPKASVENEVVMTESYKALVETLRENMPEKFLTPLIMQEVGGYTGDEIANMLNLNINTVRTRIHRGKKEAKKVLENIGK